MNQTRSARLVDAFINHPSIRPTIEQGAQRLESAELLSDDRNVVFANEQGVVIFIPEDEGYAIHAAFIPEGRGAMMLRSVRSALDTIFSEFGASKITARVPMILPAPRMACRLLGFTSHGLDEAGTSEIFILERKAYGRDHPIHFR